MFFGEHLALVFACQLQHLAEARRFRVQGVVFLDNAPEVARFLGHLAGAARVVPQFWVAQFAVKFVQAARLAGNVKDTPGETPIFLKVPA